jgi:hypothetical protein
MVDFQPKKKAAAGPVGVPSTKSALKKKASFYIIASIV